MFSNMLDPEKALQEKEKKRNEKIRLMNDMKRKKENMKPFVLFVGVKDNPLPYEKKYQKKQLADKALLKNKSPEPEKEKSSFTLPKITHKSRPSAASMFQSQSFVP